MAKIRSGVRRFFTILENFYNIINQKNAIEIHQKKLIDELSGNYSEPTLIKYIKYLERFKIIESKRKEERRAILPKYLKPTCRGIILARLYGINVPPSLIDYSREYYPLIDYISKDFSGEITLDKAFLYIILLSIAARKYPLTDFTFNLAKIREEPIFLFDHEICEKIASKFSPISGTGKAIIQKLPSFLGEYFSLIWLNSILKF